MPPADRPPTLAGRIADGVLDARLAALAWLLLERGVPVIVTGPDATDRDALADALVDALPGPRRPSSAPGGDRLVRVGGTIDAATPPGTLRAALAGTSGRSGLLATLEAADLAGVVDLLARQGLTPDEASFLGVVLVLGPPPDPAGAGAAGSRPARITVAHYLRPVVLDAGGHPRRLGPAVLAARDAAAGTWEDFAWGIGPDLAERCRMGRADFEAERERRASLLAHRAAGGA